MTTFYNKKHIYFLKHFFEIIVIGIFFALILLFNANFTKMSLPKDKLICYPDILKNFTFGSSPQISDAFWLRFIQEVDAYNEGKIAEPHQCYGLKFSWHYQLLNLIFEMDKTFYQPFSLGPLMLSVTINDIQGASILFDKSVINYPHDWRILYRASYQALFEEENKNKAAELLYQSGKWGAPPWVYSLASRLYTEIGKKELAAGIYNELIQNNPDDPIAKRIKAKMDALVQF